MTERTGADPLYWPCGSCHADVGERCTAKSGLPAQYPHSDRHKSIYRWQRWGQPAVDAAAAATPTTVDAVVDEVAARLSEVDPVFAARWKAAREAG